ncbi:hypothetical protein, variant [Aphanomyces astaci]|uniref:Uncharacterized protein n=1 Tax=Aphanomyces astaci TaxID=112090 RepID=W4FCJ5_APHAT|nr:hypothetical protein, variant [Aphanomyces astaci]ETV65217.1 hypothetical protein, variant [Aphanomyces astaci]|eukprot:XP_009845284.1 hypothetical protein, variant [Aphanomyces astaci]
MRESLSKVQQMSLPRNGLPSCLQKSLLTSPLKPPRKKGKPIERVSTLSTSLTSPECSSHKALPNASASALWGFNVYHSPELDQEEMDKLHRRRLLQEKLKVDRERKMQADASKAEQKRLAQRLDYTKYLYFASKYGPLHALLYCCTDFPGRVYDLLVHRTATTLQHWAVHYMTVLKRHARFVVSREFVAVTLGAAVSKRVAVLTQHHHAHQLRRRIFYRVQYRVFIAWRAETDRGKLITSKFQRAMATTLAGRFVTWKDMMATRKMVRQGKLCQASVKVFHRALFNRFWHWKKCVDKTKHIRSRFTNACTRRTLDCWQQWRQFSTFAITYKAQAITMQRVWKGHCVRQYQRCQKLAAIKLQAWTRGRSARQYAKKLREQMHLVGVKLRFQLRKDMVTLHETFNSSVRAAIAAEHSRQVLEQQAMHRARELAKRDASEALVKILGNAYRAILKDKIALFKSEFGMDSKRATIKATEEVIQEAQTKAADYERVVFRQTHSAPPSVCTKCQAGLPLATCTHIMTPRFM